MIIEEVENEKTLDTRGILEEDIIGVVFKDDFSYCLRFQSFALASQNDVFEHIGNKINGTRELDFTFKKCLDGSLCCHATQQGSRLYVLML